MFTALRFSRLLTKFGDGAVSGKTAILIAVVTGG
jgi:hypothetical protein